MSSYGATKAESEGLIASEEGNSFVAVKPEVATSGSLGVLAAKTAGTVLLFAGLSILAVSVSKQYATPASTGKAFDETTDTTGRVTYSLLDDSQKLTLFGEFIDQYDRDYAQDADEYNKRLAVFKSNLDIADDRNAKEALVGGQAVHGITRFADLTSEEFVSTYLMTEDADSEERRKMRATVRKLTANQKQPAKKAAQVKNPELVRRQLSDPTIKYVDWSTAYTTDIKNSGSCGGSWAIAATEQIESDAIQAGIITSTTPLSAQQLLSCTDNQDGCTHGLIEDAYAYVQKPGGIFKASDYEWSANSGTVEACSAPSKPYALTVGGTFQLNTDDISENTERLMVERLSNTGTVSACVDATTWSTYVSGTISNCDANDINHCTQIVGLYYSSAEDSGFYKLRNHWGSDWGIDGYVSIAYGSNVCGVAYNPIYTDAVKSGRK